jgi:hypothetical protein
VQLLLSKTSKNVILFFFFSSIKLENRKGEQVLWVLEGVGTSGNGEVVDEGVMR